MSAGLRPLVKLCSWCLGAGNEVERDREVVAKAQGALITHGICEAHAALMRRAHAAERVVVSQSQR